MKLKALDEVLGSFMKLFGEEYLLHSVTGEVGYKLLQDYEVHHF